MKKVSFFLILILTLFFYSCSQGIKGKFLSSLSIGSNSNDIFIWISYSNSNYIFYSFQEVLSSTIDQDIKNFLDDNFYLPFDLVGYEVWVLNQFSKKIRIIKSDQGRNVLSKELQLQSEKLVQDILVNKDKSLMFLILENITPSDDYLYSVAFSKETLENIEFYDYYFTNVFRIETDDLGNFYILQLLGENVIRIDVFSSSFILALSKEISFTNNVPKDFSFSSAIVVKPFNLLLKFDSNNTSQRATILSIDLNSDSISKKYDIILPRENFQMMSYLRNGFVACATYKNNLPVLIFFDPFSPTFKISHEMYINFDYPLMMRGFKISKDGKMLSMYADFPDNKVLFYYWDLISAR
ncbi:MAG: hypothetical protein N2712_06505 [Brevinematales bacterium]|nr:hypothetical protein [Brevinematales bacterium]